MPPGISHDWIIARLSPAFNPWISARDLASSQARSGRKFVCSILFQFELLLSALKWALHCLGCFCRCWRCLGRFRWHWSWHRLGYLGWEKRDLREEQRSRRLDTSLPMVWPLLCVPHHLGPRGPARAGRCRQGRRRYNLVTLLHRKLSAILRVWPAFRMSTTVRVYVLGLSLVLQLATPFRSTDYPLSVMTNPTTATIAPTMAPII